MIRVVGANPAMDRISTWPPLRLAAVNRAVTVTVVPGGKGFNVARAAVQLGEDAVIYGFLGGHVGEALREMISAGGVIDRHTTIAAGTRVCFIVVEPQLGRSTVLNEPGPDVSAEEVERLLQELRSDCQPADLVVLSGSLPDSVASAVAGEVIKAGNDAGARTIVDIHGEALHEAVARRPWMLKCNRHELLQLLGDTDSEAPASVSSLARQMQSVRERGIAIVVVTMGSAGAMLADADGVVHVQVPQIEEVNPTGSGDLLLAGLAVGIQQQRSVREALVLGAACGTAGATHLPPELPPDFEAARWSADVHLEVVAAESITLGIDVGTTHTKVLALDVAQGRSLAVEAAVTPSRHDADGDSHRAADVLDTVVELMARVAARLDDVGSIVALSAASVGEEVVLLDDRRQPIGDTIAWYDPRGGQQAEAYLAGRGGAVGLSQRWPPDATFSLFKLIWLREHRPDEFGAATGWTDLGDYVLCGLGGEPVMDWTHASRAGAFDLVTRAWDDESLEAAGLNLAFPRLVASGSVVGSLSTAMAQRTGIPAGVAIVSGGHDHLCAAYGGGLRHASELFLSAGTSEAHLALVDMPLSGASGPYHLDQGCFVDGSSYYVHINIHAGHYFKQWRGLLYPDTDDAAMYEEIESAATDGASRFELADDLRHARLLDVPYGADRAVLMRAILDGLAARSADIVDHLERACGRPFDLILAAGHPTQVPLWRRLRTAAYERPMAAIDEPESAAFGAAVIAARATAGPAADGLVARRVAWT